MKQHIAHKHSKDSFNHWAILDITEDSCPHFWQSFFPCACVNMVQGRRSVRMI